MKTKTKPIQQQRIFCNLTTPHIARTLTHFCNYFSPVSYGKRIELQQQQHILTARGINTKKK
ncbi:hypothetical protein DOY81_006527, partial [Sarcophaga bullata]